MTMFNSENFWVLVRYGLTSAGSLFAGYNWYNPTKYEFWLGVVIAGLSAAYGQYKTTTPQQVKTLERISGNS